MDRETLKAAFLNAHPEMTFFGDVTLAQLLYEFCAANNVRRLDAIWLALAVAPFRTVVQ